MNLLTDPLTTARLIDVLRERSSGGGQTRLLMRFAADDLERLTARVDSLEQQLRYWEQRALGGGTNA